MSRLQVFASPLLAGNARIQRVAQPVALETKDYQNHRELKLFRAPEGPPPVPRALVWRRGRGQRVEDDGHLPPQPPSPALLEITNNPPHNRRIIKNNLQELSVPRALFFFYFF